MKKVLHILHELKYSGAEIMYAGAAPVFQELGYELYVINSAARLGEYAVHFEKAGYKVLHWPYPKGILERWKYYANVIKFIKSEHIDVIHIHDSGLKWGMSYCAWRAGIKVVYTCHNCFPIRWFSRPYQIYLRYTAKHIFSCKIQSISNSVYNNELHRFYNRTTLINNWYNNRRFFPATEEEKQMVRKGLGILNQTLVLISVGGCSLIKQHTEIIKALSEVIKAQPDVLYLHLGEGSLLDEEVKLAQSLGVSDHIRFLGNKDDVRRFLIAADIYLMTSQFEGISITTIEAMACRIPAILYDVPGLRDFNSQQECAMLIEADHHILAKSILSLYSNKSYAERLKNDAYKRVNTIYNMDVNVGKIVELYKK